MPRTQRLWQDVLNFIGDSPVEPVLLLRLLDTMAPRWPDQSYFMSRLQAWLVKERAVIEREVAQAQLGYWIWVESRRELWRWAEQGTEEAITEVGLRDWWLGGRPDLLLTRGDRVQDFMDNVVTDDAPAAGRRVLEQRHEEFKGDIAIRWLHWNLHFLEDFEKLRALARKTWRAGTSSQGTWSESDLEWVNRWFSGQEPMLLSMAGEGPVDPRDLEICYVEQGMGMGGNELQYCLETLIKASVADFVEELLDANRYPQLRGSLHCIECGQFVGRSRAGYGQLYCTATCKKRAAKRRYRSRVGSKRDTTALRSST